MYPYDDSTTQPMNLPKRYSEYDTLHLNPPLVLKNPTSARLTLDSLPMEILGLITSYVCSTDDSKIHVRRLPSTEYRPSDLVDGAAKTCWSVTGYPWSLMRVNRTLHAAVNHQLWHQTIFVLSLTSSDTLVFLKHALTARQRVALRRIRLTRFMLSWEDGVGDDIWLKEGRREPAFLEKQEGWRGNGCGERVEGLVAHLQKRHLAIC